MRSLKLSLAITLITSTAFAQKLANIQGAGVAAPAVVKVDGNLTEWGALQAYNHATDVFYTLANDNDNLYLVIRAENQAVVNKIINGGISLGISKNGKHGKSDVNITYPIFEKGEKPVLGISKLMLEQGGVNKGTVSDLTVSQTNSNFSNKSKLMMVTGVTGVDTLLSVYNETGIKVAAKFDDHLAYSCELAVPVKKIGLESDRFTYHITLNGGNPLFDKLSPGAAFTPSNDVLEEKLAVEQAQLGKATAVTDFWGEYTMVKK